MPKTLPPAKRVIMETLGCSASEDGAHLYFSAATGIPIKESTTEDADDPANGQLVAGAGAAIFLHGGKLFRRTSRGVCEVANEPNSIASKATGSMAVGRRDAAAVLLDDGTVLICGGSSEDGSTKYDSAEIYDPETGEFSTTGSMGTARYLHTATKLADGTVLVAGGYGGSTLSSCEIYDPETGTWSSTGSLGSAQARHQAILLNDGDVLLVHSNNANCERFSGGTWSSTGAMATSRSNLFALALLNDGRVLVAGGDSLNTAEIYDPATEVWTPTGNMTGNRGYFPLVVLADGKVLAVGGYNTTGNVTLDSCEIFDPETELWTATGSLNTARYAAAAFLTSNGVQCLGSLFSNGVTHVECEIFDPTTELWTATGDLSASRRAHTATLLNDGTTVLVAGGRDVDVVGTTCELYGIVAGGAVVMTTGTQTITGEKNFAAGKLKVGGVSIVGGLADAGTATIGNGDSAIEILTTAVQEDSAILLSTGPIGGGAGGGPLSYYGITPGTSFMVYRPDDSGDQVFSWAIINLTAD